MTRREPAALDDGGWVESITMRWAIQSLGSAITASRVGLDVGPLGVRGDQHADTAVPGPRLEHELVEDVQRLLELRGCARS